MSAPPSTTSAERDERLALLLDQLAARAREGQTADIDAVAATHPDLATELRQLWAAAQFAEAFARPAPLPSPPRTAPSALPPAAPESLPRAFGDYDLVAKLGQGGMGIVYKAWERSLRRPVALKMIRRGEHATPADLARFQVEAQACAHLDHPNIVPLYGAGERDGQAYLAMRYVEGETLAALLARGPLRPREAARLLATVARAVHYAHERGILHRDLKPSNVLLDRAGQPHVTDFGLAKRVTGAEDVSARSGVTASGSIVGTPAYMAPEQISGSRGTLSSVSDVWALGVILYEMLTGRPPFQAPTQVDVLFLVLDQDPVRPGLLNPKVDPDLELICLKCIQKEPELRYASARELADDLEAYLNGETLSVRRSTLRDLGGLFSRLLRETHHAVVLENWGILWMCHSLKILLQCVLTTWMAWSGVKSPWWYLLLWGGGLIAWGGVFWKLRKRAGPVLFIERQVAHVWAAAVAGTIGVFILELLLDFNEPLKLAPMLAIIAGMTFVVKAGMLSGSFYVSAMAMFLTAIPMALWPDYGVLLFGVVTAVCFFVPGLKYHLQRQRSRRAQQVGQEDHDRPARAPTTQQPRTCGPGPRK
jgi:serine/threonine-protein kinase